MKDSILLFQGHSGTEVSYTTLEKLVYGILKDNLKNIRTLHERSESHYLL